MNHDERVAFVGDRLELIEGKPEKLWAKGEFRSFPSHRVPIDALLLNAENRRFAAERIGYSDYFGREFDPTNEDDEASVVSLLLDVDHDVEDGRERIVGREGKETRALRADWKKRRQEHPLWIRPWGLVCYGNRRLAMLKRLREEEGGDTYDYVEVIVLPESEFDDDELFEMEATEQLTEGLKVRYSDINLLLTLQEAAERLGVDWDDDDSLHAVALRIQHLVKNNPNYAHTQLRTIRYMRLYLELNDKSGRFDLLRRKVEVFRDVGKNMAWVARNDPAREDLMLRACFASVAAEKKHDDVRALRQILKSNPDEFDELVSSITEMEDEGGADGDVEVDAPEDEVDDVDEGDDLEPDESEDDLPEFTTLDYPKQRVSRLIDRAVHAWRDARAPDAVQAVLLSGQRLREVRASDIDGYINDTAEGRQLSEALEAIVTFVAQFDR